ncbi:MAG: hypothetical protein ABIO24_02890 [Saprospiraceae bacterium]
MHKQSKHPIFVKKFGMASAPANLERLLLQLDPKYWEQVQMFLQYLVFLQQKEQRESQPQSSKDYADRLEKARAFKGDAPFPEVKTSKYDVYEQ